MRLQEEFNIERKFAEKIILSWTQCFHDRFPEGLYEGEKNYENYNAMDYDYWTGGYANLVNPCDSL